MTRCSECFGSGKIYETVRCAGEYLDADQREVTCHECGGEGEWLVCLTCEGELTESGWCAACESSGLPEIIEEKPLGNGWHRIAA